MYPKFLQSKAEAHYHHFQSVRRVAQLNVSKSTAHRWIANDGKDVCRRIPQRRSKTRTSVAIIASILLDDCFATCTKVRQVLLHQHNIDLSVASVHRAIKMANITFKVTSRSKKHYIVDSEHPFIQTPNVYEGAISVDESSFKNNDMPLRGWSHRGARVPRPPPGNRKTVSLLLAIDATGVVKSEFRKGAYNGATFAAFLQTLSIDRTVIMDNCAIHKSQIVKNVAIERGLTLVYTPPYCPWFNPVEHAFSVSKNT